MFGFLKKDTQRKQIIENFDSIIYAANKANEIELIAIKYGFDMAEKLFNSNFRVFEDFNDSTVEEQLEFLKKLRQFEHDYEIKFKGSADVAGVMLFRMLLESYYLQDKKMMRYFNQEITKVFSNL